MRMMVMMMNPTKQPNNQTLEIRYGIWVKSNLLSPNLSLSGCVCVRACKRVSKRQNIIFRNRKTFITIKIIRLKYDRISIAFLPQPEHFVTRTNFILLLLFYICKQQQNEKKKKLNECYAMYFFITHIHTTHTTHTYYVISFYVHMHSFNRSFSSRFFFISYINRKWMLQNLL